MAKYKGTGTVTSADFKAVKYVGKTKGGAAITITLPDAINMGNLDWAFAEKDDVVAQVVFTGTYSNTDEASDSNDENFEIETADSISAGSSEIMLGVGVFYIDDEPVALTRGGGQFVVEREFREINADGDRGPVRVELLWMALALQ